MTSRSVHSFIGRNVYRGTIQGIGEAQPGQRDLEGGTGSPKQKGTLISGSPLKSLLVRGSNESKVRESGIDGEDSRP